MVELRAAGLRGGTGCWIVGGAPVLTVLLVGGGAPVVGVFAFPPAPTVVHAPLLMLWLGDGAVTLPARLA